MLFAGIGIPIMAALSGNLGDRLGSTVVAAMVLLSVGLLITAAYLFFVEGDLPSGFFPKDTPWYLYSAGAFFVFYIISITWVGPRFGISNAVSFVLLGQLIAMTAIDQYGLLGARQVSIDFQRLIGLLLMSLGVFLVVKQ